MREKCMKKQWSFFLCIVLIVAMALSASGCNGSSENGGDKASAGQEQTDAQSDSQAEAGTDTQSDSQTDTESDAQSDSQTDTESDAQTDSQTENEGSVLGEGDTKFDFTVVDQDGEETLFEIHTDKETVGEALQDVGLIEGEEGEYGLFVKTVNGITADYDKDGVYWAFYVNDEYAAEGVDSTKITEGDTYAFKVE